MNEMNPNPPGLPPKLPTATGEPPLGSNAEEQVAITNIAAAIESVLRQPRRVLFQLRQQNQWRLGVALLCIAMVSALVYGFVAGTFTGGAQLWAAPLKIAGGLLFSALICLPSLYIFSCLSGAQARLTEVWGLVTGLLALMTILLIGFAPVAWLFSQSTESVTFMGTLHLLFWTVAVYFGFRFLITGFRHLQLKSLDGLRAWMLIFLLVMMQMTAALRPIIGQSDTLLPVEKKFFLKHWLDNLRADASAESRGQPL